ncbi:tRNA-uridine aminocarboxypropyltransferase [Enterovibrio norvegicus]|uniref:tRNA-uridine aminocarboxypropyltransferase n=1 Tax=Enterovibrio norvegicus TaxID=188144 RepID=UPI0010BE9252|nr:tRNA-uridine aminocarboxypropyltransferase [Enterovibrio norvegicus]TKF27833.1 DTW domain-containing protein [Enterovibrio norvegicus]
MAPSSDSPSAPNPSGIPSSAKPAPCSGCGFHYNCLCDAVPRLDSKVRIELLMHETETERATNTGQLLEACLSHCRRHVWQRKDPPIELLTLLADPAAEPVLVFLSDDAVPLEQITVRRCSKPEAKPIHFIILDATWQQAKKMRNKSPWLQDIPTVVLPSGLVTEYSLRRNQPEGALCTCEVGIVLMKAMGELENAEKVDQYFHHFMDTFDADRQHKSVR